MYSEMAKKATIKYLKTKRDKLTLNLPLGNKERYKEYAEKRGISLTALVTELIEEDMKKHS